jgi:hypothetical protein
MVKSVFSKSLSFKRYMRLKIEVEKKKRVKRPNYPWAEFMYNLEWGTRVKL